MSAQASVVTSIDPQRERYWVLSDLAESTTGSLVEASAPTEHSSPSGLASANLTGANLTGVDPNRVFLRGAYLAGAGLGVAEPVSPLPDLSRQRRALIFDNAVLEMQRQGRQNQLARAEQQLAAVEQAIHAAQARLADLEQQLVAAVPSPHAAALAWIKQATGNRSDEGIAELLGVSRPTLDHWRQGRPIRVANRRRLLAVRDVLERAADRLVSVEALAAWLETPALPDGRTPSFLLEHGEIDQARALASSAAAKQLDRGASATSQTHRPIWTEGREALPPSYDESVPGWADEEEEFPGLETIS